MTENVRKRTSKWDVVAEPHLPGITRQDGSLPVIAVDPCREEEVKSDWNSSNVEEQFSRLPKIKAEDSVHNGNSEADNKFSKWSGQANDSTELSKDFSQRPPSAKQYVLEPHHKDGLRKAFWEPPHGNQTAVKAADTNKETDEWDVAQERSYSSSMSPGLDSWRQRSRSISPRAGWRRSRRSRSRSKSRSRSRSRGPYSLKHESERWAGRGRIGAGKLAPLCRDFAAGRCRRGSQCKYLHEDGSRRHSGRHHETDLRENRYERRRYSGHGSKENYADSMEQSDYTRDKLSQRHGSHHDDSDWVKPELHKNNKSTERCYDFTKGRCHRGSSCRYLHHEGFSHGGWSMRDEAKERPYDRRDPDYDRRDPDASFGQRAESRKVSDTPCKYFAEGRCRRGEDCKFSHQGVPQGHLEGRPGDDNMVYNLGTSDGSSRVISNWSDQTNAMNVTNSLQWISSDDGAGVALPQSMDRVDSGWNPRLSHHPEGNDYKMLAQEASENAPTSQGKDFTDKGSGQIQNPAVSTQQTVDRAYNIKDEMFTSESGTTVASNARPQAEMNSASNISTIVSGTGQSFSQDGQSRYMGSQSFHARNLTPNVQFQQFVSTLPITGQLQQLYSMPSNGQSPFIVPPALLNTQNFNIRLQNQPVHPGQNKPICNPGGQIQQNLSLPTPQTGQSQQNFQIPHCLPPPQNGQSQQNLNLGGQIQYSVSPFDGLNQQNVSLGGQGRQSLPAPQNEPTDVHLHASDGQNQYATPQPPNLLSFNSDEKSLQIGSKNTSMEGVDQKTDESEKKPLPPCSDAPVTHKVVTSEQAARITNLSASLAQFFHNSGLPPSQLFLSPSSMRPPAQAVAPLLQPSQGSWTQQPHVPTSDSMQHLKLETGNLPPGSSSNSAGQKVPIMVEAQTNLKSTIPISVTDGADVNDPSKGTNLEEKQQHGNHNPIQIELSGDTASKEANDIETGHSKKEQVAHSEDLDADIRTDGESKKSKDAKAIRMFKCALVEFVKDMLKPAWKEGHLSKEAHKTIVKKVVEKVTGAIQGPNVPQTQEKIDLYLSHSKTKLNKLVQAYVEKYVKN